MQLSQSGQEGQTAVLYVPDVVMTKAQPGKSETRREKYAGVRKAGAACYITLRV